MFIQYQTFDYHYASKLNPRLYDIIDYEVDPDTSVLAVDGNYDNGAPRSAVNLHTRKIEDLDKLLLWIENLIPQCARNFVKQDYLDNLSRVRKTGGNGGLRSNSFKIDSCWGILFNKGNTFMYLFSSAIALSNSLYGIFPFAYADFNKVSIVSSTRVFIFFE